MITCTLIPVLTTFKCANSLTVYRRPKLFIQANFKQAKVHFDESALIISHAVLLNSKYCSGVGCIYIQHSEFLCSYLHVFLPSICDVW